MSRLGVCLRIVAVLVVAFVVSFRSIPAARAQDSPAATSALEVDGTGAFEVVGLMNAWSNSMFKSKSPTNLSYIASGDRNGRSQLAAGQVDFAISGMPLTDADQQKLAARNVGLIEAPLATVATAFLVAPPNPHGITYFVPDPTNLDTGGTDFPFTGDIRMPNSVLARTMSGDGGYDYVSDPAFVSLLNLPSGATIDIPGRSPVPLARSDAGAANYYLEKYILQFSPDTYNAHLVTQKLGTNVVSEDWPLTDMTSRSGSNAAADFVAAWNDPTGGQTAAGGIIGQVDQSTAADAIHEQQLKITDPTNYPGVPTPLTTAALQNGAGEYVKPTPESITTAAVAGGGQPLFGLTQSVPGAYPFTWTTNLFVPATGLSIDKTNAIATFLRYATGPGQDLAAGVNDGKLPDTLRAQAATQADLIVKGNCKAAGGTTTTDRTGGPDWPTGVAPPAGGALVCVAPAGADTTTTVATSASGSANSGSSSGASSGFGPTSFASAGNGSTGTSSPSGSGGSGVPLSGDTGQSSGPVDGGSSPSAPGDGSTTSTIAATNASFRMPLGPPDDGEFELDRFTTVILGALAFLVVRAIVRPHLVTST